MKKQLLFSVMMLIGLTSIAATNTNFIPQGKGFTNTSHYRYVEPIMFMEQGVEFLIFPDGSFDFNTHFRKPNYGKVYSNQRAKSHRSSVNNDQGRTVTVNGRNYGNGKYNGVMVQQNYYGNFKRIGNVTVEYDKKGRIKRLGSIKMNYDDGKLSKVGGLKVKYNRWDEIISTRGIVNDANRNYHYGPRYSTVHVSSTNKNYVTNNDFYYYKQGTTVIKQKRIKR